MIAMLSSLFYPSKIQLIGGVAVPVLLSVSCAVSYASCPSILSSLRLPLLETQIQEVFDEK